MLVAKLGFPLFVGKQKDCSNHSGFPNGLRCYRTGGQFFVIHNKIEKKGKTNTFVGSSMIVKVRMIFCNPITENLYDID